MVEKISDSTPQVLLSALMPSGESFERDIDNKISEVKTEETPLAPWVTIVPKTFKAFVSQVPNHQFKAFLPHIEQWAAQGMQQSTIADRLGIPLGVLKDAMDRFPDVYYAFRGGRARGIEEVSGSLYRNAVDGESSAAAAYIKGVGEWSGNQSSTNVNINIGAQPSGISYKPIKDMFEEQFNMENEDDN